MVSGGGQLTAYRWCAVSRSRFAKRLRACQKNREVVMEDIRSVYLRRLEGRLRDITWQVTRVHYTSSQAIEAWHPAINAYRCQDCVLVVAELAGVDRSKISLAVEPRRLWLRGRRLPPEPDKSDGPPRQILAMEID